MKTIYIYLLRNKITDKIYIGQTNNPQRRLREHNHRANTHYPLKLYKDIEKYGIDNFEIQILEEVPYNLKDQIEEYYIKKYNATSNRNYNTLQGSNILENIDPAIIVKDYLNGDSASKIGKKYGVKHPQIITILKQELGEEKYYQIAIKHTPSKKNISIETIVDLIENQGHTKKETAEILGVCDSTIVRRYNNWKKEQDKSYVVNPTGLGAKSVDANLIIKTYSEVKSTRKTSELTGYARSTVRKYLKKEGML
jgi:group I intron endonuclease